MKDMENRVQQIVTWKRENRFRSVSELTDEIKRLRAKGMQIDAVVPLKYEPEVGAALSKEISEAMIIVSSSQTSTDGK